MRQKFTLITLGVKDFQKALAFYEGLGWKKSQQSQGTKFPQSAAAFIMRCCLKPAALLRRG